MNGMALENVRAAINKMIADCPVIDVRLVVGDEDWDKIHAAIVAAMPPGVNEICAALDELNEARPSLRGHHIRLQSDRTGSVYSPNSTLLASFYQCDSIPATIRSAIPKPEPTVEEGWETVRLDLIRRGLVKTNLGKAIARLRERLEDK